MDLLRLRVRFHLLGFRYSPERNLGPIRIQRHLYINNQIYTFILTCCRLGFLAAAPFTILAQAHTHTHFVGRSHGGTGKSLDRARVFTTIYLYL